MRSASTFMQVTCRAEAAFQNFVILDPGVGGPAGRPAATGRRDLGPSGAGSRDTDSRGTKHPQHGTQLPRQDLRGCPGQRRLSAEDVLPKCRVRPLPAFPLLSGSTATFPVTGPCRRTSFRLAMCARVQERLHVAQEAPYELVAISETIIVQWLQVLVRACCTMLVVPHCLNWPHVGAAVSRGSEHRTWTPFAFVPKISIALPLHSVILRLLPA